MAIQFIPGQRGVGAAVGQAFEKSFPEGISKGVESLIQDRLAGLQRQKYEQAIGQFLPREISQLLSQAPPEERKFLWQNLQSLMQLSPQAMQQVPQSSAVQPEVQQMMQQAKTQPAIPEQQRPQQFKEPLFENPADKRARLQREISEKKLALQEKALGAKEKLAADKETKQSYDETVKAFKNAKESNKRLERMEELINRGNFGIPVVNSFLKTLKHGIFGAGIDLTHLMTADAQEFDKLTSDFAKFAKDFFPGRVTDNDLKMFMSTLPNLTQTEAGMRRVINSMKAANKASELRYKAMKDIIKANDGKRPFDLDIQVEERIGDQLDKLAKQFVEGPFFQENVGGGITNY